MKIIIIAAMTKNKVIGLDHKLPWKIKEELQYFRRVTLNKPIIMGSNTFNSLNQKPLLDRYNIVLTRNIKDEFEKEVNSSNKLLNNHQHTNLIFVNNIVESLTKAKEFYIKNYNQDLYKQDLSNQFLDNQKKIFIIGGREIYSQFLSLADQLYLSIINNDYEGNVFFPEYDVNQWQLVSKEEYNEFVVQIFNKVNN